MRSTTALLIGGLAGAAFLAGIAAGRLSAQTGASARPTILLTKSLAAAGFDGVVGRGEVPPGVAAPKHFHHGDELVVLLEGEVDVEFDGAPTVRVKAGEAMHVEANRIHRPKSVGTVPAKYISVWIVEKGKPLAVSVP